MDCGDLCCENAECVPCPPECVLELALDCPDCIRPNTTVENCVARPLEITMLFAGGDCNMSRNCQEDKFICEDFNGGPPHGYGDLAYIKALDTDEEQVFFEGWVPVGSLYIMQNNFERFPADQIIKVYSSDAADEASLQQMVQYHSSCSQNLDLLNRFGSQVIWGWYNEEQGNITGATNFDFGVSVDLPIDAVEYGGEDFTVTGLTIVVSSTPTAIGVFEFPPVTYDLTDSVVGTTVASGSSLDADLSIDLNMAVEQEYTFLITMTAETASGVECTANELIQFTAGGSPLDLGFLNDCPGED